MIEVVSSKVCGACDHLKHEHDERGCHACGCPEFTPDADAVQSDALVRIAVALESIAKSLAAMRLDGPR